LFFQSRTEALVPAGQSSGDPESFADDPAETRHIYEVEDILFAGEEPQDRLSRILYEIETILLRELRAAEK